MNTLCLAFFLGIFFAAALLIVPTRELPGSWEIATVVLCAPLIFAFVRFELALKWLLASFLIITTASFASCLLIPWFNLVISAHNRTQIIKAVSLAVAGVICYLIAWVFFKYGLTMIFSGFRLPVIWIPWLTLLALLLITGSGYYQWQQGDGFKTYIESSLFHDLGDDSASAVWTDHYARRVTGPAYIVSQVCLGGPLFLLKAWKHYRQRLVAEAGLEARLKNTLSILRAANKWQSIDEHPQLRREILMLAQMKQIDFSAHKGNPRIKASPLAHGV